MRPRILLASAAMLLLAGTVQAQDKSARVGVGVSLAPAAIVSGGGGFFLPIGLGNLYFPVLIGRSLKLEGEAGIIRLSSSSSDGSARSSKALSLRIGAGIFRMIPVRGSATSAYFGPRVGLIRTSTSTTFGPNPEQTVEETDWVFGMAVGGEHFLSPHFSLGGELQLNYISHGNPTREPSQGSQASVDRSTITSNGLAFLRLYF